MTERITEPADVVWPPREAADLLLLSVEGLAERYLEIHQANVRGSKAESKVVGNYVRLVARDPEAGAVLLGNLATLMNDEVVIGEGNKGIRDLSGKAYERILSHGLDIFRPSADTESIQSPPVSEMRDRYVRYRKASEEDRHEMLLAEARRLLRDPDELDHFYEMITLISDAAVLSASGEVAQTAYHDGVTAAIIEVLDQEQAPMPTSLGMEHWVRRWALGAEYSTAEQAGIPATAAETTIRKLIAETETPSEITDLLYEIAVAGFSTGEEVVMDRAAQLISWETDLMTWGSPQGMNLEFAKLSEYADTRQKASELQDVVLTYLGVIDGNRLKSFADRKYNIWHQKEFLVRVGHQFAAYPSVAIEAGFNPEVRRGITGKAQLLKAMAEYTRRQFGKFMAGGLPAIYMTHNTEVGPLGEWFRDFYASLITDYRSSMPLLGRRILAHLNFPDRPVTAVTKTTPANASKYVADYLRKAEIEGVITARTYWNTLGYLRPEGLDRGEWTALMSKNTELRERMLMDKRHSLSPIGDRVLVMNFALKELGFEFVEFHMDDHQKDTTIVTLRIGNATFSCYLDRDYNFREIGTGHNLGLGRAAPLLECTVLSHLHQIHCCIPSNKGGGRQDTEVVRKIIHRRAHRHRLPPNQKPTEKQILKVLTEYGIDLVLQNARRREQGKERLITWVSEVNIDELRAVTHGPVISEGHEASEQLRQALNGEQQDSA